MKTFARAAMFSLLLCLLAAPASAIIIRVPADQPTIQQAINVANNGDLILVSPGTYSEHIDYHGKAITIQSTDGPTRTTINGNNSGTVVTFQTQETRQSVLTGFTIEHGNALAGAGIMLNIASPTITKNIFRANAQQPGGFGAAIGGSSSSAVVEGNTFVANTCNTQEFSGVVCFFNLSSPRIINNVFAGNPCKALNIAVSAPSPNPGMAAREQTPLAPPPTPVVANNTIVQNSVGVRMQAGGQSAQQLYANNILTGNGVGFQVDFLPVGQPPAWNHNLVFANTTNYSGIADQTGQNGNISVDPMFLPTRSRGDFELQIGSPAIDAGTLSVPNLPPTDFLGNPRVVDGDGNGSALPDIGAYEFIPQTLDDVDQPNDNNVVDEVASKVTLRQFNIADANRP